MGINWDVDRGGVFFLKVWIACIVGSAAIIALSVGIAMLVSWEPLWGLAIAIIAGAAFFAGVIVLMVWDGELPVPPVEVARIDEDYL